MSVDVSALVTENIDIWSSTIKAKNSQGRGSSKKTELYGIKKLRELILELAVRGLLVPQDPNDEPASDLLKKIAYKKEQLIKDKKIKNQKLLSPISDEEVLFKSPKSWCWVRLQDVSEYIQRGKGPKYADTGRVKVVSQKCVQSTGFTMEPARYVEDDSLEKYQPERFLRNNDMLWNSTGTGTVGRINVINDVEAGALVADSHVTVIRTLEINTKFLWSYISAPGVQSRINPLHSNPLVSGSTNQVELNTTSVTNLLVPLPPIQEQHRIVTKVNDLMALCDQLEQQQESSISAHQTLVDTLLGTLVNAAGAQSLTATDDGNAENARLQNAGDTAASGTSSPGAIFGANTAWQHIAENFDVLFTTEHSINQLKQTILQLAVMGKLVPQDPNDEPASVLLKKIADEKSRLVKEKKIKKQKPLPPISEEEKPFELPEGWEWCRFDDVALKSEAGWSPQCLATPKDKKSWGVLKVSAVSWGIFKENENKQLPPNLEPKPEYEVKPGDFLISRANTAELVARGVVVPKSVSGKLMMSDKIIRFTFSQRVSNHFISLLNNSNHARDYYASVAGGTSSSMKNVTREQIRALVFGIPTLNEQHRIVTKVNELMTLCDTLLERIKAAQATQLNLTDAIAEQAIV